MFMGGVGFVLVFYLVVLAVLLLGLYAVVRFGVRDGVRDVLRSEEAGAERRRLADALARSRHTEP
jgi:hypothetical protein